MSNTTAFTVDIEELMPTTGKGKGHGRPKLTDEEKLEKHRMIVRRSYYQKKACRLGVCCVPTCLYTLTNVGQTIGTSLGAQGSTESGH
jgi:hypothetical protein